MDDLYDYNNNNFDNNDFSNSGNDSTSSNFTSPEGENRRRKKKDKRNSFITKMIIASLVVGMAGGAASYTGIHYLSNVYSAYVDLTTEDAAAEAESSSTESSSAESSSVESTTALDSSTSATSSSNTVADVAASAIKSLVSVTCTGEISVQGSFGGQQQTYEYSSAGSGVIIDQDDDYLYIVTNAHVIEVNGGFADVISLQLVDETEIVAEVVGSDSSNDIAVLSVPLSELSEDTLSAISIATIGDSDALVLGEQVVAIGNALGYGQSVTSGYISAFDRSLTLSDSSGNSFQSTGLIQTDASINSGDSGGGLFNMNGELIAINEAKSSTTSSGVTVDNMGYAIPMSKATPIIQSMIDGTFTESSSQSSNSAYLGITVSEITEEASRLYNMPYGLYVSSVIEGSPAESAGIQVGDIISAIDGEDITTYDELAEYIASKSPGDSATITVYRTSNGMYIEGTIEVVFGENENASS